MDSKLIRQINALNGDQFNFQPARVHGVTLVFTGSNDSGQTGALSDLGSVIMNRDDRQIVNAGLENIADMDDIRFGSVLFSSVTAGDFLAAAFIPFFASSEDDSVFANALNITDESELNFEWVPGQTTNTVFTDLSCKVYADLAAYRENYEPRLLRDNQSEDGSVSSKPYQLNKRNIAYIFLRDVDDVVDLVQLQQNGRSVYSPQDWDKLEQDTLRQNRLETSTFALIELQTFSKGNAPSTVNRDSILSLTTSSSGDVEVLIQHLKWWDRN